MIKLILQRAATFVTALGTLAACDAAPLAPRQGSAGTKTQFTVVAEPMSAPYVLA